MGPADNVGLGMSYDNAKTLCSEMTTRSPRRTPPGKRIPTPLVPAPVESRLGELQAQLDQLRSQVRQAQQLSALGAAAATIAHEFNNLLTPVLAYATAALGTDDTELHRKALTRCVKNVGLLVPMSQRILEIGAASTGTPEDVPVAQVVRDATESLCRDLAKDGINFVATIDESLTVRFVRLQLQQVLFNLFLNAREALCKVRGGRLTVSASCENDCVVLEVGNGGDPIPVALLPHVFESFQSSKTGSPAGEKRCSGLGLALCRDLVEENGGTISVTSDTETGTTFRLVLPSPA